MGNFLYWIKSYHADRINANEKFNNSKYITKGLFLYLGPPFEKYKIAIPLKEDCLLF
jgi:hypothetical protein